MKRSLLVTSDVNVNIEYIARLAQKYIANRPVIILGSGASIPYGIPSMSDLAGELLDRIDLDKQTWLAFKEKLEEENNLESVLHEVDLEDSVLKLVVETVWQIIAEKDSMVYNRLLENPRQLLLTRLIKFLLRTARPRINIVTTNYDRLAEYAANIADAEVITGFSAGWMQRFVPDDLSTDRSHSIGFEGTVYILKVHGSLDWFLSSTDRPTAVPLAHAIPETFQPLIVTPGTTKYREVHRDPFRSILSESDNILRRATCFLCIGFGFNDEHVQPILIERVLNSSIPITIVTKDFSSKAQEQFLHQPPENFLGC